MTTPELRSLPMLRELIGFDTTSRNSNLELIDYVREYLSSHGVESHLTYDDTKGKANLYATLGPVDASGGLILSGYTDVVPVEYAAALIAFLQQMAKRQQHDGPFDEDYDIAHTTVHVGTVHGGTALNIVPADCQFDFEIRHLPQDDPEQMFEEVERFMKDRLLPEMRAVCSDADIRFTPLSVIPTLNTDEDHEITRLAKALTGANAVHKVAYNCEAGLFHQARVPTIICGPGHIEQAHKPNEFIEAEQIARCEDFVLRLAEQFSLG